MKIRRLKTPSVLVGSALLCWLGSWLPLRALAQTAATVSPEVQSTIKQFAGKDARPIVPVAMLNVKTPLGEEAARWLSMQRQQPLISYSLKKGGNNYIGELPDSLNALFRNAEAAKSMLYFEGADALFGKAGLTAAEQLMADKLIAACKKFPNAILLLCATEACWFALAKAGFGIVSLD